MDYRSWKLHWQSSYCQTDYSHATECWKNLGVNGDFRDAGRVSRTITTPPENENGVCEDRNLQKAIYSIKFEALNPENQRMIVNY